MKKILFTGLSLLLAANILKAQVFQKVFDIPVPDGSSNSCMRTSDGGYIVGANSDMGAQTNYYLIKFNSAGTHQWSKMFGGPNDDELYEVSQTTDGGYFCSGFSMSFNGNGNGEFYAVKTDASGNMVWSATYGGSGFDVGTAGIQTADGGYIMTGWTASFGAGGDDVYVVKIDASGNLTWSKTFGGSGQDQGYAIKQTSDGGYIVSGRTASFGAGGADYYVLKLDGSGNLQWSKTYGGTSFDESRTIQQTADGGYIIGGWATSFNTGGLTCYAIKTDGSGNIQWQKLYTDNNGGDHLQYIIQTSDGGYAFTGLLTPTVGNQTCMFVKLDNTGSITWANSYGGNVGESLYGKFQQTPDGGYVFSGGSASFAQSGSLDVYLVRTNSSGLSGTGACNQKTITLTEVVPTGSVGSGGATGSGGTKVAPPTVTSTPATTVITICSNDEGGIGFEEYYKSLASVNLYPNPSNNQNVTLHVVAYDSFDSKIELTDNIGRIVYTSTEKLNAGENKIALRTEGLPDGFFLHELQTSTTRRISQLSS